VAWDFADLPAHTRPGPPALFDVTRDGVLDAIVPLVPEPGCAMSVCASVPFAIGLDGRSGRRLWILDDSHAPGATRSADDPFDPPDLSVAVPSGAASVAQAAGASRVVVRSLKGSSRQFVVNATAVLGETLNDAGPEESNARPVAGVPWAQTPVAAAGLAEPRDLSVRVVIGPRELRVGNDGEVATAWIATAIESPPSIADVNGDGVWDVLVVADGSLHALSTGSRGRLHGGFPHGNDAATGVPPETDDLPAAYDSRVEPRDRSRWLLHDREPTDTTFVAMDREGRMKQPAKEIIEADPSFVPKAADAQRHGDDDPLDSPELVCGRKYGLNEGYLLVREGRDWTRVAGAPWPVTGMACEAGALLLERADGRGFRLPAPIAWASWAWRFGAVALASGLLVGWRIRRKLGGAEAARESRLVVLSDAPRRKLATAHEDQQRLVKGLINVLDNEGTQAPVAIALFGPWGSGKSSIMRMLQGELRETGRYIDVWFNAWRYRNDQEIAPALLQSIVDEVRVQTDWPTRVFVVWDRVRNARVRDILFVLGLAALGIFAFAVCWRLATTTPTATASSQSTSIAGTLGSVFVLLAALWHKLATPLTKVVSIDPAKLVGAKDSSTRVQFAREFATEFERVSSRLPADTRLIVYIDDLDRCRPDRVVEVLETISMLADTGCAFFVVAFDPTMVRRSVEIIYKDIIRVARREAPEEAFGFGRRFIEKMITLGVNVPAVPSAKIDVDARTQPGPRVSFARRLWLDLLPSRSWLVALVLAAIPVLVIGYAVRRVGGPLSVIDESAVLLSGSLKDDDGVTTVAPSAAPIPPAEAAAPSTDPPTNPTKPVGVPQGSGARPPPARPIAPVVAAPAQPVMMGMRATSSPATDRALGELMMVLVAGFFALCTAGFLGLLAADAVRRRRLRSAPEMGADSPEFTERLLAAKGALPDNPRNVVRFTNLLRFLYEVVCQSPAYARRSGDDWTAQFFQIVTARWLGTREPKVEPWLRAEIDRWMVAPIDDGATRDASGEGPERAVSLQSETVLTSSGIELGTTKAV
jgi:Cdc6-like AAA superfamily ATPase